MGPGREFIKPLTSFFQSIPFWKLSPNYTVLQPESNELIVSTLASPERVTSVSYICTPESRQTSVEVKTNLRLPGGEYTIQYINPVDLSVISEENVISFGLGGTKIIEIPAFQDDILVMVEKISNDKRLIIKGTE
jgi:hypothetical protein